MNSQMKILSDWIHEMKLTDGIYTHYQFGTFKVTNGKLDKIISHKNGGNNA